MAQSETMLLTSPIIYNVKRVVPGQTINIGTTRNRNTLSTFTSIHVHTTTLRLWASACFYFTTVITNIYILTSTLTMFSLSTPKVESSEVNYYCKLGTRVLFTNVFILAIDLCSDSSLFPSSTFSTLTGDGARQDLFLQISLQLYLKRKIDNASSA